MEKLSIVVPAFNEAQTVCNILRKLGEVKLIKGVKKELIVVNDCSSDSTGELVKDYIVANPEQDIKYFEHSNNQGKGAALHTGFKYATGDFVVIQDADLECDPFEFNKMLRPIFRDNADVVYGSRYKGGEPHRVFSFWHKAVNKGLTFFSNLCSGLSLTDMETCYKMFRTEIIQGIDLKEKRFGFEPEVTAKIAKIADLKIYEVGISYYGRTRAQGKKINWKDGFRALYCIVKYNIG